MDLSKYYAVSDSTAQVWERLEQLVVKRGQKAINWKHLMTTVNCLSTASTGQEKIERAPVRGNMPVTYVL